MGGRGRWGSFEDPPWCETLILIGTLREKSVQDLKCMMEPCMAQSHHPVSKLGQLMQKYTDMPYIYIPDW